MTLTPTLTPTLTLALTLTLTLILTLTLALTLTSPGEVRASGDGDELRGDALVAGGTLELCRAMTNFSGGSQGTLVIGRKHSSPGP